MRLGKATGHIVFKGDEKKIARVVAKPFVKAVNAKVRAGIPRLTSEVRDKVAEAILTSYEVTTICSDLDLQGQLGITEPEKRFKAIADAVSQSVFVIFRGFRAASGGRVTGRLELLAAPRDNRYLLELPEAWANDGGWLDALLHSGDAICVAGYQFMSRKLSPESLAKSRTGLGLMIERAGKGWKVPADVSGTEENNLLTRSLQSQGMQVFIRRQFEALLR